MLTTITIKNPKNFSADTLEKLLKSVDIELISVDESDINEVPAGHLASIRQGMDDVAKGKTLAANLVHAKAREICSK